MHAYRELSSAHMVMSAARAPASNLFTWLVTLIFSAGCLTSQYGNCAVKIATTVDKALPSDGFS